ncbi:DUF4352 domain-containing protein [Clostridium chromiireducens]|uniref:DUF4352 domain-containing protein n=1 Tax=Clostridium chromiireducens TaxID=225345 RepID=A0A964RQG1_9CLOT|nr:DUF4352 domain-containing protein [Clostridium chromiireducens]MVX65927.1 DUF4352 domain-containing protein [Clostridium chromiireducens]
MIKLKHPKENIRKTLLLSFIFIMILTMAGCSETDKYSKNLAMQNIKSMNDTDLQNNMKKGDYDNSGVALACAVQSSPNDTTIAIADIKITNANKMNSLYTAYTDLSLIDENGNVYPPDNQTFALDNRLPDKNIKNGESVQGLVLFRIPNNKNKFIMKYDYDSAKNKSYYKPILVSKADQSSTSSQNSNANPKNNTINQNDYINVTDVKCSVVKDKSVLQVDMKINIGNSFVGTLYGQNFIIKQNNGNGIKSYSALFYDNPDAKKATVVQSDQIDPTPGDTYYVTMFFKINPNNAYNFSLNYSYGGSLIPLGNFSNTK